LETDGNNRPNRRAFVNRNSSDAVDILFQEAGATTSGTAPKICGMKFETLPSRNMFHFDRPPMTGDFGWSARRELPLGPLSHSENSLLQDRTVKRRHDLRFLLVAKIANG
jgi:hypothetical protein